MTVDELNNLEVGDTVYYYRTVNPANIGTISASIVTKKVKIVFRPDDGNVIITLYQGGVILDSLLNMFDINKEKLLYRKIKDIKKKVHDALYGLHKNLQYPNGLQSKVDKIMQQKNIQKMLEKYPEILI